MCITNVNFGTNKTPVEVIQKGAFGGTYFRDIYSGTNDKWYRKSLREFNELKNIDQRYYCSNYYDLSISKYGVKCGVSSKFWKIMDGYVLYILMFRFCGISNIGYVKDL